MLLTSRLLVCASLIALFSVSVTSAHAEEAPPTTVDLGDEEALVRYALSHNPDLRAVRWDQEIASAGVTSASALSNPIARAEWLHVQSPANYGWGIGVEWAPPQPGLYGSVKDSARALARASKADFSERSADLEAAVRGRYAQIAALDEELALAEKSLETRRALKQALKERLAHGASSRIDLSLASVSLARGEQERDLLLLGRATEQTRLEALLGLPPSQSLGLKARAAPDAPPLALGNMEQRALAQRAQLRADEARTAAADHTLAAERARRWPWLALQARYRRHDQSTYANDVTLGVELTLPLFNQNPGPIAAAEASRRASRDVATAHRLGIEREVRVLHAESARRREIAEHYAQSIAPVLSEHAALVKAALAGLELDVTALLAAEDLVTKGGIEYLEARLAQRKAEIALSRALGEYGKASAAGEK